MKEYKIRTNYKASKINEYKTTTHFLENINNRKKPLSWQLINLQVQILELIIH